jgi:hypothetical protein
MSITRPTIRIPRGCLPESIPDPVHKVDPTGILPPQQIPLPQPPIPLLKAIRQHLLIRCPLVIEVSTPIVNTQLAFLDRINTSKVLARLAPCGGDAESIGVAEGEFGVDVPFYETVVACHLVEEGADEAAGADGCGGRVGAGVLENW